MAERNPLCPDGGGHNPHTFLVHVEQGEAVMSNGKGHVARRPMELPDGNYVSECGGWKPEPIPAWRPA